MKMDEYKRQMRYHNRTCLVPPEILEATNFRLKGHILSMIKDIPFYRKDHRDDYKHIDKVLDIVNYFNVPYVPCESALVRMLLVIFTVAAKKWLKSLPPRSIRTSTNL